MIGKRTGAYYLGEGKCDFCLWAPLKEKIFLRIHGEDERLLEMNKGVSGYFHLRAEDIKPGTFYSFRIDDDKELPDPASFFQPEGIMGPSSVVDHSAFVWEDQHRQGRALKDMVIYELHTGTFSKQGTFQGVIEKIPYLKDLGIDALELMPVAQFPGERNWGYDGVYPFAVQNSYGGPQGLKKLVNECHKQDISVILDVVYNHLGPEGNFLPEYMPCFTDKYRSPWGRAVNFDDYYSHGIREFFIQNALYWFEYYHIDALRLDAVHGIFDMSAKHFLREMSEKTAELSKAKNKKLHLVAESDLNDPRLIMPYDKGGYGLDGQWNDDFHHCLHALLTGERQGYYQDFGSIVQLAKALKDGFVYDWKYSRFRKKFHGSSSADIPPDRFVVFSQNHDQTGNRLKGERLSALVSWEGLKVAAGLVILSANIPLLFMGEEYGEDAPFLYFMSFYDRELIRAVREGRKKEFASFNWSDEPPDPHSEETFLRSKLDWEKPGREKNKVLREYYKNLILIRKNYFDRSDQEKKIDIRTDEEKMIIAITNKGKAQNLYLAVNFDKADSAYSFGLTGNWEKVIDSAEKKWLGPGSSVPEQIKNKESISLRPLNLVLFAGGK